MRAVKDWRRIDVVGAVGTRHAQGSARRSAAAGSPRAGKGNLAGRLYLERGKPVTVLTSWGPGGGPRNVEIERDDGSRVVRPFRGLRRPAAE